MYVDEVENINGATDSDFVAKEMDKTYYCFTMTGQATLGSGHCIHTNLLLQHHNFKTHTDYTKLTENLIRAWRVKADAFVIRKEHPLRATNLFDFNERIGGGDAKPAKT